MKLALFLTFFVSVTFSIETLADIDFKIKQVEARLEALEQLKRYSQHSQIQSNRDIEVAARLSTQVKGTHEMKQ